MKNDDENLKKGDKPQNSTNIPDPLFSSFATSQPTHAGSIVENSFVDH